MQGFVDEQPVGPVESVNGVAEAVRFQPDPEPVASIAVSVPCRWTMVLYPERASVHLIVAGAATASAPAVTVSVPLIRTASPSLIAHVSFPVRVTHSASVFPVVSVLQRSPH